MSERKRKVKKWGVADCETDAFDGQRVAPFLWVFKDGEREEVFASGALEFVEFLREYDGTVYFHNGGKFDMLFLSEHLERGQISIINGRLARAKLGKCELRDSWLIVPCALSSGGEKLDFDYNILRRERSAERARHMERIVEYALGDVRALYNLVAAFRSEHGAALTLPGAAWKHWVSLGGCDRDYGPAHDKIFRPWYYGGRVEALQTGALRGEWEYLDINSSYPYAMLEQHPLGCDFPGHVAYDNVTWREARDAIPGASFWRVRAISNGALPYRGDDGRLTFPRDGAPREYLATGWEINAGVETGTLDVLDGVGKIPRATESMRPYVEYWYERKARAEAEGDTIGRLIAKLFGNSCYGKAGSNPENYMDYFLVEPGERESANGADCSLHLQGDTYDIICKPTARPRYYDVALAASITGLARANLWRAMCSCEGVAYCDTDSIICRAHSLPLGKKLGEWKREAHFTELYIAGKKLYAGRESGDAEWKTAHKGFSRLDTSADDIIAVCRGEVRSITKSAPCVKMDGTQQFITRRMKMC